MSKDPQQPEEPEYRVYRSGSASTHAAKRKRAPSAAPPAAPDADAAGGAPGGPDGAGAAPSRRGRDAERGGNRPHVSTGGGPPQDGPRPQAPAAGQDGPRGPKPGQPDYRVYRSQPRGLGARLRGESESDVGRRVEAGERAASARHDAARARQARRALGRGAATGTRGTGWARWAPATWTPKRGVKYFVCVIAGWVALSAVLFMISAETKAGNIPASLKSALSSSGGPMLVSAQNVLVLGLDNRPTTGYSANEGGLSASDRIEADARTDSIMIWRVGGGVSRRLSIPRDTLVNIPGVGESKINAAWSSSPGKTVQAVERLTGVKINHVVVVDLANFPKFIDDIGGVTVQTPKICSEISGGVQNGGYTLNLKPGDHHLSGTEALTLARTRENSCNPGYTDIQREEMQQEIMNGIKGQLFSFHAFTHLPFASWDAPGVIQTDMGGITLLELFASSEIGGSSKPQTLNESGEYFDGQDVLVPNQANVQAKVNQLLHG